MRIRSMKYLNVILTVMISLYACSAPKVVTPEISRKSYKVLKETQPDCSAQIGALEAAEDKTDPAPVTSDLILDALYCYRSVWKHWENEYRVLDAQLDAINNAGGQK